MSHPRISFRSFLERALHIRPGEGRRTALLFVYLLFASALFILGRTVRDTLFLSRYPLWTLPWMFVCYGIASALTVVVYGRLADKMARHRQVLLWTAIGLSTYIATWAFVQKQLAWIYPVFYVWSEVVANLFIVQFWTLANDLHDARSAKRLFGAIGAARVLGVVLVGTLTGAIVRLIGTEQLLFVLCGLMVAMAGLAFALRREPRAGDGAAHAESAAGGEGPRVYDDPYVRALSVVLLLIFVSLTVGDYQFKAIARAAYQEDDLARFFSLFYAGTGVVSFVFQIFVTPRLLARWGVGWGMTVMPVVFGGASACLLLAPILPIATVMKFADNGFQYTIHETTLQALYVPFAPQRKARTRAFLDAVVKPLSYGIGGLVLALLAHSMPVHRLTLVTLPLVGAWLLVIPLVRRRYLAALQSTLGVQGALALGEEPALDADGRRALMDALLRGDPRHALVALDQLAHEHSDRLAALVARLAGHADPDLRAAALDRLVSLPKIAPQVARAALLDPVPEVRAAAARAFAALARDEAIDDLAARCEDVARPVRVAALCGLLAHGGVEGGIVGGARMAALLASARPADREEAALALGGLGAPAFRPVRTLLDDHDPSVRRAALKAAVGVRDARLIPPLLAAMRDPRTRKIAGEALVAVGAPAINPLAGLLSDPATPRELKLLLPRFLREIPHSHAYELLRGMVSVGDSHIRLRIFAALSRLRKTLGRPPEPIERIEPLLRQEMVEALNNLAGWEASRPHYDTPLLAEEIEFRQDRAMRRVLRILELRYERAPLGVVRSCLESGANRANALEVLDTLLDPALRPLVMPYLDDRPAAERLAAAGQAAPPRPDPEEFMRAQCRHANPYVAFVALDALFRQAGRSPLCRAEADRALVHESPLVREAAALALAGADPDAARAKLPSLTRDPDPIVARHAQAALDRLQPNPPAEPPMYSTAEKILFLKGAPVFTRVEGEDLAPLARVAEVVHHDAGRAIFTEGELGDSLYVIVRGRVAIECGGKRLSGIGPGEAFGEMAILDAEPRSATARAESETELLRIGSEEFYGVLRERSEIAEGIIRMLTHRLREAMMGTGEGRSS